MAWIKLRDIDHKLDISREDILNSIKNVDIDIIKKFQLVNEQNIENYNILKSISDNTLLLEENAKLSEDKIIDNINSSNNYMVSKIELINDLCNLIDKEVECLESTFDEFKVKNYENLDNYKTSIEQKIDVYNDKTLGEIKCLNRLVEGVNETLKGLSLKINSVDSKLDLQAKQNKEEFDRLNKEIHNTNELLRILIVNNLINDIDKD